MDMPTYHFDIVDRVRLEDPIGVDCSSEREAKTKAEAIARQIAHDLDDREIRSVIVVDDGGEELCRVPVTIPDVTP